MNIALSLLAILAVVWAVYATTRRRKPSRTVTSETSDFKVDAPSNELYSFVRGRVQVTVDQAARTATFDNCHLSNRFWTLWSTPRVVCDFSEIVAVYGGWSEGYYSFVIVTTEGKAHVCATREDYPNLEPVLDSLSEISIAAPRKSNLFSGHPAFWPIVAMLVGLSIVAAYAFYY